MSTEKKHKRHNGKLVDACHQERDIEHSSFSRRALVHKSRCQEQLISLLSSVTRYRGWNRAYRKAKRMGKTKKREKRSSALGRSQTPVRQGMTWSWLWCSHVILRPHSTSSLSSCSAFCSLALARYKRWSVFPYSNTSFT